MDKVFRIQGGVYGLLVGDALGVASRDRDMVTQSQVEQFLARHYSDAGSISLCTMSSLTNCEAIDAEDMLNLFNEWYIAGFLGCGEEWVEGRVEVSQAIRHYHNGMPPNRCGSKDERANDSGLMRMFPIAVWQCGQPIDKIVDAAHEITKITNNQVPAQVCSALYCLLVRGLILQNQDQVTELLKTHYLEKDMVDHSEALDKIKDYKGNQQPTNGIHDSFWNAWTAYASHQEDFVGAMTEAIGSAGGNASTVAIAGSLGGVTLGMNDIPQRWINQLSLSDDVINVIEKFVSETIKRI